ncbi:MAG: shikimate kinase [Verrucomicrobiota bacterium]|jgi:shikimate kinase
MQNIVLIGMPGAGKSTVGVILAKHLSKAFVDTDLLIQNRHHQTLQEILDQHGYLTLREFEEREILRLHVHNAVIATGGSAVYSERAMTHLKANGAIVYLKLGAAELLKRINNFETRGIAMAKGQSFLELYREREILYHQHGQIIIECAGKNHEQVVADIVDQTAGLAG